MNKKKQLERLEEDEKIEELIDKKIDKALRKHSHKNTTYF